MKIITKTVTTKNILGKSRTKITTTKKKISLEDFLFDNVCDFAKSDNILLHGVEVEGSTTYVFGEESRVFGATVRYTPLKSVYSHAFELIGDERTTSVRYKVSSGKNRKSMNKYVIKQI